MATAAIRLTPHFAARIDGADITRPLDDATWAEIRAAFEEHSVLVFRGRTLDDETQIAFSHRFGSLEVTRSMTRRRGRLSLASRTWTSRQASSSRRTTGGWS